MYTSMRIRQTALGGSILLAALAVVACGESPAPAGSGTNAAVEISHESTPAESEGSAINGGVAEMKAAIEATEAGVEPASIGGNADEMRSIDIAYDLEALAKTVAAADAAERPEPGNAGELTNSAALGQAGGADTGLVRSTIRYTGGINLAEGEEKTYDFGKIREGDIKEKIFELVSDGPEALVIKGVKPSCGCTKAEIELYGENGEILPYQRGTEIPTGSRFRLVTEVSAEGKKGSFGTAVSIYTNAPGGTFNVRLAAVAEPVLVVTPDNMMYFGEMTTEDQVSKTVHVASAEGSVYMLRAVTANLPESVKLTLVPVNPNEDGRASEWDVTIVAGPGLPAGIRNYPCALRSDIVFKNPKVAKPDGALTYHTISLAVQARVSGMVNATPAFLGFGMIRPGQDVDRTVLVEAHDDFQLTADIPVAVEGLYGGEFEYADRLNIELLPSEDGSSLEIKLTLQGLPEDAAGSFGGILTVKVGHPSIDELKVRFSGVCRLGLPQTSGN